jgi:outer membrane receptor protein involved in Fe transport
MGQGKLTGTIGFYKANQEIKSSWLWTSVIQSISGNGTSTLVNASITTPGGVLSSQDGYWGYGTAFIGNTRRYVYDLSYDVNAPYGSINYAVGKLAIGASVRYDFGRARGAIYGSDLGNGRVGVASVDINGDSVISNAETRVSVVPLGSPAPVRYNYDYLSYSAGVNYRVSPDFSAFARYSKGARANADRILYAYVTRPTALYYVSPTDGSLVRPDAAYDTVKQAEGGVKFRKSDLSLFVTGFWAETKEHNISLDRTYRAYGAEFEGAYRKGIFNLTAGATWTHARIVADAIAASNIGHTPKHQADLIFQFSPYVETEKFTLGTNVVGTTWSYATDLNGLRMPGYVLVNAVAQYRPIPRVQVSLNANNLFNRLALLDIGENTITPNNLVTAKVNQGRTVSASLRFEF